MPPNTDADERRRQNLEGFAEELDRALGKRHPPMTAFVLIVSDEHGSSVYSSVDHHAVADLLERLGPAVRRDGLRDMKKPPPPPFVGEA